MHNILTASGAARKSDWGLTVLPSPPSLSPFPPSPPIPLEVGPLIAARGSEGALKLPQQVRAEPSCQTVFGAI